MNLSKKLLLLITVLSFLEPKYIFANSIVKIKIQNKVKNKNKQSVQKKINKMENEVSQKNLEKIDIASLTKSEFNINQEEISKANNLEGSEKIPTDTIFPQIDNFFKTAIVNPLKNMDINSLFGLRNHPVLKKTMEHKGIDLKAKIGTEVMAFTEGIVKFAGYSNGYGNLIIISHPNGYETRYAHLSKIKVEKKQKVNSGDMIASSGKTGRVTGPNLHFEIRKNEKVLNPIDFLKL